MNWNFYWLLECFNPGTLRSLGYADKALAKVTVDAYEAHWFGSEVEANRFLDKAPAAAGTWRATEHGFEVNN